ncbi:hypothetical protein B4N84_27145 [Flavobacterium sp. IR1]|nr:hypothetical protein B4N84_27145 [Flavobacterium sp. IR1]
MYKQELTIIVQSIIASNTADQYAAAAKTLSDFYKKINSITFSQDNETAVKGGIALSSLGAADCVDDYLRTVFFIKGIYKALTQLCHDFPDRSINVLYAGCGPYATLMLPLLPLFNKERINAVLIDINAISIASMQKLVTLIGLDEYQIQLLEADAITYTSPENFSIDLAVSETMDYALTNEPQVAIVQNIAAQLPAHGILIPKEIRVDLMYTFFDQEPYLKNAVTEVEGYKTLQPYPHSVFVNRLFTINKELFSKTTPVYKFESDFYKLPDNFSNHPDVCVFTEIKIFDDVELKTAESYITNPYCVVSLYSLINNSALQLVYDFSAIPKWSYNLKNE